MPTEGQAYMAAFGEASTFLVFVVMTGLLLEQHQQFAKQMTIGSLLTFIFMAVQLKMPKEVNAEENVVIQLINLCKPLRHLTYFELGYILKVIIYPSLFNTTMNIARIIDVEPTQLFKLKLV